MRAPRGFLACAGGALAALLFAAAPASAVPIIFDNFNANEGHFGYAPSFASQSTGESANSTADRVTTDGPFEGAGHQKLVFRHDGTAANLRIRHLSGAAPFDSAQAGTPANNIAFTTSTAVDAYIGFYLKTTATGLTVGLNLDDSTNTGGGMDMGTPRAVIGDGVWRLYEWKLNDPAQWDAATSIGGNGTIEDGQHTIDSIYFFTNKTGAAEEAYPDIFLDFLAMNDGGSVALLVPEPSVAGVLVGGVACGLLRRRRAH